MSVRAKRFTSSEEHAEVEQVARLVRCGSTPSAVVSMESMTSLDDHVQNAVLQLGRA